jgi:exodeoxyribonuclease-3
MRIATWNINSVRLRFGLVKRFLAEAKPDVLCLQETKAQNHQFPEAAFAKIGYVHQAFAGDKGYNGVAILSKLPIKAPKRLDWCAKGDSRHMSCELPGAIRLHNFYVPAGGDVPDTKANPKFAHKLQFVEEMTAYFEKTRKNRAKVVLVGDLNIAPFENDVWSHKQLLDVVSHTPQETERMAALYAAHDFVDAARHFRPEPEKVYTWWSYRAADWRASDRGRRLDHVWVTPALKGALRRFEIFKDYRDGPKPSDHVPTVVDLAGAQ